MPRGGARVGAGRPRGIKNGQGRQNIAGAKRDVPLPDGQTPLEYMLAVIRDPDIDESRRDRMAVAAAPYLHTKMGERRAAAKDEKDRAAQDAAGGQFGAGKVPRLVVNNR